MAKVKLDASLSNVRGRVGNYVFRERRGLTVMSSAPTVEARTPKPKEAAAQDRFRQAAAYATEVLSDPIQKMEYTRLADERGKMVRPVLISDFMTPPEVTGLHLPEFSGQPGDMIKVLAWDDVEVVSVAVKITDDAAGTVIESGACVKTHGVWVYLTTTALLPSQRVTIEATAWDRPGHSGSATKSFP